MNETIPNNLRGWVYIALEGHNIDPHNTYSVWVLGDSLP